jgi:soluble lytic murein transglycosylase-like protein
MLRLALKMIPFVALTLLTPVGLSAASPFAPTQEQESASSNTVTARTGDTIARIARRVGVPAAELAKLNNLDENSRLAKGTKVILPARSNAAATSEQGDVIGHRITLADGYTFEADEVWKSGNQLWYRKGNVTQSLELTVKSVNPIVKAKPAPAPTAAASNATKTPKDVTPIVWINLVGGARFRVDEVQETNDGAWYSRDKVSIFIAKERIARIERELPSSGVAAPARNRDWTSGSPTIDQLIKTNGERFGVDPYLVFLVIEQESHFHIKALSPKGARGLMQLMPGTARRLGVSRPFDAAENIKGGTQYLKELMNMFGGNVNLVLASYNAGEGAVIKYGRNVPPYRETRDYVRTIGKRYGLAGRQPNPDNELPTPQR